MDQYRTMSIKRVGSEENARNMSECWPTLFSPLDQDWSFSVEPPQIIAEINPEVEVRRSQIR
jgi:hypothetical protein